MCARFSCSRSFYEYAKEGAQADENYDKAVEGNAEKNAEEANKGANAGY